MISQNRTTTQAPAWTATKLGSLAHLVTADIDTLAVSTRRPGIRRDPTVLHPKLVVPERTRRVAQLCRVPNLPGPEEPVLQRVYLPAREAQDARLGRRRPVHPFLPLRASPRTKGRLVRRCGANAAKPLAAVVDGVGPLAAEDDAKGGLPERSIDAHHMFKKRRVERGPYLPASHSSHRPNRTPVESDKVSFCRGRS
jgi:hypothetical protein